MRGALVVVHDIHQARRAVSRAQNLGVDLTLLSAPSAAATLGPAVFREMIAMVRADLDENSITFDSILDCGEDPGPALQALRSGCIYICSTAPETVFIKLTNIAEQCGGAVVKGPLAGLDLSDDVSDDALDIWLRDNAGDNSA
jgi:hypothetical protein